MQFEIHKLFVVYFSIDDFSSNVVFGVI